MRDILQDGNPILRQQSENVPNSAFGTAEFAAELKDMAEALDAQKDGVAIAAPQVGISKRIFLVRYDRMDESDNASEAKLGTYINPRIVSTSRKKSDMPEGCLSVRGLYGTTHRNIQATVTAQDENGTWFTRGAGGILAQAFQHEIDHLDGILFIDHAQEVHERSDTEERAIDFHGKHD